MKYYLLVVKGDVNDADEVTEIIKVDINVLTLVKKMIPVLEKKRYEQNWNVDLGTDHIIEMYDGVISEDDIYTLEDVFPYSFGDMLVHTITSIEVYPYTEPEKLM
jgi:hypothetical protein